MVGRDECVILAAVQSAEAATAFAAAGRLEMSPSAMQVVVARELFCANSRNAVRRRGYELTREDIDPVAELRLKGTLHAMAAAAYAAAGGMAGVRHG